MKLKEFIKYAKSLKKEWQELEVKVVAQNGMEFEPKIKGVLKEDAMNFTEISHLRITY